jgi:hypothetical protein
VFTEAGSSPLKSSETLGRKSQGESVYFPADPEVYTDPGLDTSQKKLLSEQILSKCVFSSKY